MRKLKLVSAVAAAAMLMMGVGTASAERIETRTYLINGLASAVPFIGYGFANLKTKIPGSKLYSYLSPVEGAGVIQPQILADIRKAHRRNPDIEINLIGISFGANLITRMAANLQKDGIEVSYMGLLDGLPLAPVTSNVRRVDNFICTTPGCLRDRVKLARGNDLTIHNFFSYRTSHIALGDNKQ
ncbi:MAG: hypothetical protein AAF362_21090, partial [Pseudomonadota bacterium]